MGDRPVVVDTRKALAIVALVAAEGRPFARDELAAMFWPDADDEAARGRPAPDAVGAADGDRPGRPRHRPSAGRPGSGRPARSTWSSSSDWPPPTTRRPSRPPPPSPAGRSWPASRLRDSPDFDDWQAARAVRVERLGRRRPRPAGGGAERRRRRVRRDRGRAAAGGARPARRARPASGHGAARPVGRPGRRDPPVPRARRPVRPGARRRAAARDDRAVRGDPGGPAAAGPGDRPPDAGPASPAPSAASDPRRRRAARDVPLVGRDRELAAIDGAWRAATPDGRVVLLEGEAGIGKTRLAEAVAASVAAAGGTVLAARGYPGEGAIAYGPIAELLRAGLAAPDGPARLAGAGRDGPSRDRPARRPAGRPASGEPAATPRRTASARASGCSRPSPARWRR